MRSLQLRHAILVLCISVVLILGGVIKAMYGKSSWSESLYGDHVVVAIIDQALPPDYSDSCVDITRLGIAGLDDSVPQAMHGLVTLKIIADSFHEDGSCLPRARDVHIVHYSISSTLSFTATDLAMALKSIRSYDPDLVVLPLSLNAEDDEVARWVRSLSEDGALVYASAGNTFGLYAQFPASMSDVIAVGALDSSGDPMSESARKGVDCWCYGEAFEFSADNDGKPARGASVAVAVAARDLLRSWLHT